MSFDFEKKLDALCVTDLFCLKSHVDAQIIRYTTLLSSIKQVSALSKKTKPWMKDFIYLSDAELEARKDVTKYERIIHRLQVMKESLDKRYNDSVTSIGKTKQKINPKC
jgi:hypothetical protein